MNSNWPRWIYASIVKHFKDSLVGMQMSLMNADLINYDKNLDIFELRVFGPTTAKGTVIDDTWHYTVSFLCKERRSATDQYSVQRTQGVVIAAFTPICVYRYGDGPDDDSSFLGRLDIEEPVDANTLFSLDDPERIDVGTLTAKYKIVF